MNMDKRVLTVAYLTGYLDTMLRLNAIPKECGPDKLRAAVDQTRAAFDLPSLGETHEAVLHR